MIIFNEREIIMDKKNRIARHFLREKSPAKMRELLDIVGLPEDEYTVVWMHDIQRKDLLYIADTIGLSERRVADLHRRALKKIVDTVEYMQ